MGPQQWPEWSDNFIKAGFPKTSLLAGTEPAVWQALGHLTLNDFDDGKQVVVRKALDAIGLGWVATNTTPFRIAVGGLFDAAERFHRHPVSRSTPAEPRGRSAPAIHIEAQTLPETDLGITGPLKPGTVTEAARTALWYQLERFGACVIRQAVPASTLTNIPAATQAKVTKLARTMGNGVAGTPPSVYMDVLKPPAWHDALEQTLGHLLIGPGAPQPLSEGKATLKRKSILIRAGEGAENWAHQDNNSEQPPVQAVLMLSEPQKDFKGGEFYVARQKKATDETIHIARYEVSFSSPGDLVIFNAGKHSGWWHGMLPVGSRGINDREQGYLREVIGLLQPTSL